MGMVMADGAIEAGDLAEAGIVGEVEAEEEEEEGGRLIKHRHWWHSSSVTAGSPSGTIWGLATRLGSA